MSSTSSPSRARSLSPWSKIRAMVNAPADKQAASEAGSPTAVSSRSESMKIPFVESSEESDVADAPKRPLGRVAQRLMQQATHGASSSSEDETQPDKSLGRRRLLVSKSRQTPPSERKSPEARLSPASRCSPQSAQRSRSPIDRAGSEQAPENADFESDAVPGMANARFQELVAKKRAERKAKEEALKAAKTVEKQQTVAARSLDHLMSDSDDENGKRLTQQSRPSRKASKKALEEMHRETQRLARNQQLTHQAKVKLKITTNDLFKLFNYRQQEKLDRDASQQESFRELGSRERDSSDLEVDPSKDTPPTSPPTQDDIDAKRSGKATATPRDEYVIHTGADRQQSDSDDTPTLESMLLAARKDKGKAVVRNPVAPVISADQPLVVKTKSVRKIRIIPPKAAMLTRPSRGEDDDLEILALPKQSRFANLDEIPTHTAQEPAALLRLRALAHVKSPNRQRRGQRREQSNTSNIEMYMRLQEQARRQALLLREEKISDMAARGIHIRTDEEREKEQLEIDNILEKARDEVLELARKEKKAAKDDGEDGEHFGDSEDEDEDYKDDEDNADADIELSGSEDEEAAEAESDEEADSNPLIDAEADDEATNEAESLTTVPATGKKDVDEEGEEEEDSRQIKRARRRNLQTVLSDDEAETPTKEQPTPATAQRSPLDENLAAFGFEAPSTSPAGLTQMFMGSLADSNSNSATAVQEAAGTPQGSLDFLRGLEASTLPGVNDTPARPFEEQRIPDSQTETPIHATGGSAGVTRHPSLLTSETPTKFSQLIEPTQDAGFETHIPTSAVRPLPQSTVETVVLPASQRTPTRKRGRLQRRIETIAQLSDDDEGDAAQDFNDDGNFELSTNAFDALFKAAKKPQTKPNNFNKKKSDAKGMVAEQAEESEDEYAGIGGDSDEGTDNEFDEDIQEMLDEGDVDVKAAELAKLHADKERADDEKQVDKLYRDITTGLLRRKRGADMDELSDSEDEANERRRRKQMEFARMRKALLEDENLGKIAENPKKMAFLRAIEDRDDDADYIDFLEEAHDQIESVPDSQDPSAAQQVQSNIAVADVATSDSVAKRKLPADFEEKENQPPSMAHRRSAPDPANKRARTLAEIKEQVSSLLEEPLIPDSQVSDSSSESEAEITHRHPRRTGPLSVTRPSVINRLSSISQLADGTSDGPMAFQTSNTDSGGFKVPSLLRRATTNMSTNSNGSSGASTPTTSTTDNGIRRGGSKKSNIHYQAREAERRKVVEAADNKRKEAVKQRVVGTGRGSVLGMLGVRGGGFE